jgi:hypothetical protein
MRRTVRSPGDRPMLDLMYIVITIAFFALMLAYVRGCEAVAHKQDTDGEQRP